MSKKLKTLEENNAESFQWHNTDWNKPQLNGIACPECGKELYDTEPMVTLTGNSPQKTIACLEDGCDYRGYRFC